MAFMRSESSDDYDLEFFSLQMGNISASDHPAFGIAINPTSDEGSRLPQGPPPSDKACVDHRPPGVPAYPHWTHFNPEEVYPAGFLPLTPFESIRVQDVKGGARTLRFESQIYDEGSSVDYSSDLMSHAGFSLSTQMSPNSTENFQPVPVISYDGPTYINHRDSLNGHQEGPPIDIPSGPGHRYTHSDMTSKFSVPFIFSGPSCIPAVVRYEEQGAPLGQSQKLPTSGKGLTAASSRSSRRQAGRPGAHKGPYLCNVCDRSYAQRQGVTRHQREIHEPSLCRYCGDFEWGRRYLLREHIEKQHPDVDLGTALDEVTEARRTATTISRWPAPQDFPHTPENDRRSRAESHPYPLPPLPSAVTELPPISLPAMLLVDHDPQRQSAELPIKRKRKHKKAFHLQVINAHALFLSAEERVQPAKRQDPSPPSGQI
ncbi:hypothetical protein F5148DRAFT_30498 [Russula earlei]|uniref:Uncharacterized protein n=1 Tax=Russula earlei TaxID=71964 RepID=A0ACC0TRJ2_9AGAM|nr:hypothetical protein F5148DRAFT_30498 [Russula earlei]